MNLRYYKDIADQYPLDFELFLNEFFPIVMRWEGGDKLHKIAGDSGGWTLFGIAYNHNKFLFKDFNDFKDTTREEASYIAFVKYYLASKTQYMNHDAKLYYFDMAYNMGVSRAIKIMQQCAGVKADGIVGNITKSKMPEVTECCLYIRRNKFYNRLVTQNYKFRKFIKGWLNRSNSIYNYKY